MSCGLWEGTPGYLRGGGILRGRSQGKYFKPNSKVTRIEAMNILYAYKNYPGNVMIKKTESEKNYYIKSIKNNIGFSDLDNSKYYDLLVPVIWGYNKEMITKASKFRPSDVVKRSELVCMMYRMNGSPNVSGSMPFTDVKSGSWYYNCVLWAYKTGITAGTSSITFGPDDSMTKEQLAVFIYRNNSLK